MGRDFLTIIWEAETPAAATVSWDNCMLVVKGSEASLTSTTIYSTTSSDWSEVLANAGFGATTQAYKSAADFYAASPTPSSLYVLGLVSGQVDTYQNAPLSKITDTLWETPVKPPLGWYNGTEQVRYYPDADNTGYFVNAANGSAGVGFEIVTDGLGNWNGRLDFSDSGLSGFEIDNPPLDGCKITASFTIASSLAEIGTNISNYKIAMMAAAYENTSIKEDYPASACYFGSQVNDLSRFMGAVAGKHCVLFWALPGAADPTDTASGIGGTWGDIKTLLGSREDVALIKAQPSSTQDDMAAGYMGIAAGEHPHRTLTYKTLHMGITAPEDDIALSYWENAQVAAAMAMPELSGTPNVILGGYTLGVGYSARINYVRCKNIISQELRNTIAALIASRKVKMSYNGMSYVQSVIEGLFSTLQDQGIIDGLAYVRIPIAQDLKSNTAAGQAARAAREIPSIQIGFYWYSSLERITITSIGNVA